MVYDETMSHDEILGVADDILGVATDLSRAALEEAQIAIRLRMRMLHALESVIGPEGQSAPDRRPEAHPDALALAAAYHHLQPPAAK